MKKIKDFQLIGMDKKWRGVLGILFWLCALQGISEGADRIVTVGGAVLLGRIELIQNGEIQLNTKYAGQINIKLSRVEKLVTDTPMIVVLEDGTEVTGNLVLDKSGSLWRIRKDEVEQGVLTKVLQEGYPEGSELARKGQVSQMGSSVDKVENETKTEQVAKVKPPSNWKFDVGMNLTGKSGNSDRFDLAFNVNVVFERAYDRLNLFGRYDYGTNNNIRSTEQMLGGVRYTNFFRERVGWFLREDLEKDDFEGIRLRSTTAGGFSYRIRQTEDLKVEGRAGVSLRYEDYFDDGTEEFPGLDIGLELQWEMVSWAHLKGTYTYLPSIDNFSDYILQQDTGINIPLAENDKWKLRLGVRHQYNNLPENNRAALDTSYYARLILSWD